MRCPQFITSTCQEFFAHWQSLHRTELIPHSRTFLDNAPISHMPFVLIYEVMPQGLLIRFMGTGLADFWRKDLTGKLIPRKITGDGPNQFAKNADFISLNPCGLHQVNQTTTAVGLDVCFEVVMLPLAVDAGSPVRVIAFIQFLLDYEGDIGNAHPITDKAWNKWLDIGAGIPACLPRTRHGLERAIDL